MRIKPLLAAVVLAVPGAIVALQAAAVTPAAALENGLARTPPMGSNNWNLTQCTSTFNESFMHSIADAYVTYGLRDVGYNQVNIDDCWAETSRDSNGNLVPSHTRFPSGIKALADYVHAKGLKFGIYTSAGTKTCNTLGFPGGLGHETADADIFASWGVDYLKYDNCNNQNVDAQTRYTTMRDALLATGRPIVYSICEWGKSSPWNWAGPVGNLWRTTGDISDNWSSMIGKVHTNDDLAQFAGPGHWNDPDMLEVGNGGLTDTEYRTHFSLWAMMAAPLLIGSDLRNPSAATLGILKNAEVIALDQDPLGKQATIVSSSGGLVVYGKVLANGDRGVALLNENTSAATISTTASAVGIGGSSAYTMKDLWSKVTTTSTGAISASVPAHGTVVFRVSRGTPTPPANRLEAESATITQGVVESNHAGFSGAGFVNGDNAVGASVQWTVTAASAGTASLSFGYANGSVASRPMDLYVNGALVRSGLAFTGGGIWTNWLTQAATAPVVAGTNTIKLVATTANGGPNLDYLETDQAAPTTRFEAENGTWSPGVFENTHTGYSGTGYVNTDNVLSSYVEVSTSAAGTSLKIRYANGTAADRPASISVNGTVVAAGVSFPATANWDTWATVTVPVSLGAGTNTIRVTATSAGGDPNIDYFEIS